MPAVALTQPSNRTKSVLLAATVIVALAGVENLPTALRKIGAALAPLKSPSIALDAEGPSVPAAVTAPEKRR